MSGVVFARPLPFVRRSGGRRLEVFSPKLERRISMSSYAAWQLWLAIEANPAIASFCERPALMPGRARQVIDFWVRLGHDGDEFWLLADSDADSDAGVKSGADDPAPPSHVREVPLRIIARSSLRQWDTPVANWSRIVPQLVSWRRVADPLLAQSIAVYVGHWRTLDAVLERFASNDAAMTEAALFSLVASGRVVSPQLSTKPYSGATRFRRA